MATTLNELIDHLDHLEGAPPLHSLTAQLAKLDVDWQTLMPFVNYSARTYCRNLIKAGPHYNLLVLCWKNGQRSPIHNHAGSSCAVRVLKGVMTETIFEFAPNGHVKATVSHDMPAGAIVGSVDRDMHQISNLQAGDEVLITLHLYSPPLLVMGTYSLYDLERGEEPMYLAFTDAAGI